MITEKEQFAFDEYLMDKDFRRRHGQLTKEELEEEENLRKSMDEVGAIFDEIYQQAYILNKEELADLVMKAKGEHRSMAQFARECKVKGPSTFSRIVNRLIDKPISDELIVAIAENAADKEAVTVEKLMRANGKIAKEEFVGGKVPTQENKESHAQELKKTESNIRNVILNDFYDRGYVVMVYPSLMKTEKLSAEPSMKMAKSMLAVLPASTHALQMRSSFAVHIQGRDPLYWNFILADVDLPEELVENCSGRELLTKVMDYLAPLFLRDAWEPQVLTGFKNTFVFTKEKVYKAFCDMMQDVKVNTWMSVMLVDSKERVILLPDQDLNGKDGYYKSMRKSAFVFESDGNAEDTEPGASDGQVTE